MTHADRLTDFTAHGTGYLSRQIHLADRTTIAVHAGPGAFCRPRPHRIPDLATTPVDYPGPYTHLEVYLFAPLSAPESWAPHEEFPGDTDAEGQRFAAVPAEWVAALVAEHGGEHAEQDLGDDVSAAIAEGFLPELVDKLVDRLGL